MSPDSDSARAAALGASFDPLTNLPDRNLISDRVGRLLDQHLDDVSQLTFLCVDLDEFKRVNEEHGRAAGDQMLIEVARRLGRSMRASNIIGRLQEDMFVVVIPDMRTEEQITAVASRIIANISRPYVLKGVRAPVTLTASVGIAMLPSDGESAEDLIRAASDAVDLAKHTGKGTYQFYTNETGGRIRERRSLVNRLRRAIEADHLGLAYQPKVSLASGRIVAAEALVRWEDPEAGVIMPTDFIPLAEDAGLIDTIGQKVLVEACEALKRWQEQDLPFVRLAVNISAQEVARRSFYDDLRGILNSSGIEPDRLELEITESSVMEGAEDVIKTLRDIRSLGVHLTADDFGTGYASLSYLKNFPLDGIKIDTSFVSEIGQGGEGGGLAAAVIAVGHCLGMNVVAEGVETAEQLEFLKAHQCDEVQGYLFSDAVSADAFADLVRSGAPANGF